MLWCQRQQYYVRYHADKHNPRWKRTIKPAAIVLVSCRIYERTTSRKLA